MLKIFYVHFEFEYHVTQSGYLRKPGKCYGERCYEFRPKDVLWIILGAMIMLLGYIYFSSLTK